MLHSGHSRVDGEGGDRVVVGFFVRVFEERQLGITLHWLWGDEMGILPSVDKHGYKQISMKKMELLRLN